MTDRPRAGGAPRTAAGIALRPAEPDAQTRLTGVTHSRRFEMFRHEVEALATRIVADCQRMMRGADSGRPARRDAIGRALLAGHQAVSLCQAPVISDEGQAEAALAALVLAVRTGLQPVVDAMGEIIRHLPGSVADELMVSDARSVRAMAVTAQALTGSDADRVRRSREMDPSESSAGRVPGPADLKATNGAGAAVGGAVGLEGYAGEDAAAVTQARILIADDSPAIRKVLTRLLEQMGHAVVAAADGREALDLANSSDVDLVITDIDMPRMNGIELLEAIKASDKLMHLPVIVVSSASEVDRVAASLERGADDHIGKPFHPALLGARVRSSLLRKRLRDAELEHLRRVAQITTAAEAVDRNAYVPGSLGELARGGDRLAHLARVFDRMVLHMRSREERLRARMRWLSAEISGVLPSGAANAVRSTVSPFASGQLVAGRYEIVSEIGRGGMGVVYHAIDRALHEDVAMKIVRDDLVRADTTLVDRFKSEIRLARKLSHVNVLRAHDLGEADGTWFITMEYVRGTTVLEMLDQRGQLSPDATVALGIQLADALAAAHAVQVIHRDIKPANLLVDEHGTLKVIDFGLAKVTVAEGGHTMRGVVVGTPQYMAPEQLMGDTLDGRADLFAAGVVLYECLTGRPPFASDSPVSLIAQMLDGEYTRLADVIPDVPPRLAVVIDSLLQLQPDARLQSAAELSSQLGQIDPSPRPPEA